MKMGQSMAKREDEQLWGRGGYRVTPESHHGTVPSARMYDRAVEHLCILRNKHTHSRAHTHALTHAHTHKHTNSHTHWNTGQSFRSISYTNHDIHSCGEHKPSIVPQMPSWVHYYETKQAAEIRAWGCRYFSWKKSTCLCSSPKAIAGEGLTLC